MRTGFDWRALQEAMEHRREITIEATVNGYAVTMRTLKAGRAWGVPMVVQLRVERGNVTWLQTFETVEEMEGRLHEQTQI